MYSQMNNALDEKHQVPMLALGGDSQTVDAVSEASTDRYENGKAVIREDSLVERGSQRLIKMEKFQIGNDDDAKFVNKGIGAATPTMIDTTGGNKRIEIREENKGEELIA